MSSSMVPKDDLKSVVSRHLARQDVLPPELRDEASFLDTITGSLSESLNPYTQGFSLASRARRHTARLESICEALHSLTKTMEDELQSAREQAQRVISICQLGIAFLPVEILALVFSLTIYGDIESKKPSAIAAMRLSHVCRRFRNTALSTPSLWNNISATSFSPELDLAQACVERSRNLSLDVTLNIYTYAMEDDGPSATDGIMSTVLPDSRRWRHLHLKFVFARPSHGAFECGTGTLEELQNISLPILESISVDHVDYECWIDPHMPSFSSWNMPKLRTLRLSDCLPVSLQGLSAITDFTVCLNNGLDQFPLVDFFRVLSRMSSLRDFSFRVDGLVELEDGLDEVYHQYGRTGISLVSVQKVAVLLLIDQAAFPSSHTQKFFSLLYFPNALDLQITIMGNSCSSGKGYNILSRTVLDHCYIDAPRRRLGVNGRRRRV